jgi:hypothetical protein
MVRKKSAAAQKYIDDQKRNQEKLAAGLISEKYPQVSGMVIKMTYYQELANPVLMLRTVNVFPSSYAYFHMKCMSKECEDGGFNLTRVINGMVRHRKKSVKGEMTCKGTGESLDKNHARISYEIKIRYRAKGKR